MRAVDGLLTGWHEPEATHLLMLEAFAGRPRARRSRTPRALARGYLWHEFGDSHLLLPASARDDDRPRRGRTPTLPDGRRAVLYALRRRGQATAEQVADQLDMTVSGARQHLTALVDDGLAEAAELPSAGGPSAAAARSRTPSPRGADALFPKAYGELTNELLGYVADTRPRLSTTCSQAARDTGSQRHSTRLAASGR